MLKKKKKNGVTPAMGRNNTLVTDYKGKLKDCLKKIQIMIVKKTRRYKWNKIQINNDYLWH